MSTHGRAPWYVRECKGRLLGEVVSLVGYIIGLYSTWWQ